MANGQTLYRSVGPDGRVTYADVPSDGASAVGSAAGPSGDTALGRGLPYVLRQTVERYPVTLFTGRDCAPCNAGRSLLLARGIPFEEKTVTTDDDGRALQALNGDTRLPVLRVAGTLLPGFGEKAWSDVLDAAGYAASINLPASYRNGVPSPLAPSKPAGP